VVALERAADQRSWMSYIGVDQRASRMRVIETLKGAMRRVSRREEKVETVGEVRTRSS
jgi:hypothetical protein